MKTTGLKVFYKDVPKWTRQNIIDYLDWQFRLSISRRGFVEEARKIIEDKEAIALIVQCK